jgi:HK97 family phage major capsid protein
MKLTIDQIKAKLASRGEETFHLLRDMTVNPDTIDKEACTAEFSVSSEFPVLRWFGYEILDHNATSIRMGRITDGAAHRDGHYGDQIGVIEKSWLDAVTRKLWVKVRFSKNTQRAIEIWGDIVDGIRKNVSIAYDIFDLVLERETDNEAYYRVMDWEPIHTCHTPDGADPTVGNRRSKEDPEPVILPINLEVENGDYESAIEGLNRDNKTHITIKHKRSSTMDEKEKRELAEKEAREKAAREAREKELREGGEKAAQDNAASIVKIANDLQDNVRNINLTEKAQEYISGGRHYKEFYDYVTTEMKKPEAVRTAAGHIDVSEKEVNSYSLRSAILAMANPSDFAKLGIEREMHNEIAKRTGRDPGAGLIVPTDVFRFKRSNTGMRAQTAGSDAGGGFTIFEQPTQQSFVEYLHNKLAFIGAGVTVMDNMVGDFPLVRETTEHSFTFKPERTAPDPSDVVFSKETYGPKLGGALTTLSRQLLLQNVFVGEAWARRKILGATMRGMDLAIPYGAGGDEPIGLKNMTGPHGISGVGFTRDTAIDMIQSIIAVNAELGTFNFVMNPLTKGTLMKKPISANYPSFLIDDRTNLLVSAPTFQSNQVAEGDVFYGGWSNILMLLWGYILIEANPWGSGWAAGDILVKSNIAMNVVGEYPQAISISENVN